MIAAAMLYAMLAATLFSFAALLSERGVARIGKARRWIWVVALLASIIFPALTLWSQADERPVVAIVRDHAPPRGPVPTDDAVAASSFSITGSLFPRSAPSLTAMTWPVALALDAPLRIGWPVLSAGLAIVGFATWLRLQRRARRWERATLDDEPVYVAADTGPAVFGFFRPRIVVPRWLLERPLLTRALVLEHELQHVRARDPLLLLLALMLVVLAPWNLPLWWQLRRLRLAIEIDCDARVLRCGVDPRAYGETLLDVRMHPSHTLMSAMSMTRPASQLEHRIRIMTAAAVRRGTFAGIFSTALATSLVVAATTIDTPVLRPAPRVVHLPGPQHETLDEQIETTVQARFSWLYEQPFSGTAVIRIVMNPSGWIDRMDFERLPDVLGADEVDTSPDRFREALGVRVDDIASTTVKRAMLGNDLANNIYLAFAVRKESANRLGDAALVQKAVREQFPDLFDPESAAQHAYVRMLMNSDGTIARAESFVLAQREPDGRVVHTAKSPQGNAPSRFLHLGVRLRDIEATGSSAEVVHRRPFLAGNVWDPATENSVTIDFAWLRRGAVLSN
jgi:hypothetical protein